MTIVTLTTDLGTRDHYVGGVKGELLRALPHIQIIDISHDITPFNIMHGSFVLKNCYHHFPDGTFHLIGVNMLYEENAQFLIVVKGQHTFIGPDNGIFGLLWDGEPADKAFRLFLNDMEKKSTLPMKDLYVRAMKHLLIERNIEKISEKIPSFRQSTMGRPIVSPDHIRGSIIYFDHFENAIVNIQKEEFESIRKGRKFIFYFKRYDDVESICENYSDVPESEKLCMFNSSGYLEIAINKGNARGLLNLSVGDIVQVEFRS